MFQSDENVLYSSPNYPEFRQDKTRQDLFHSAQFYRTFRVWDYPYAWVCLTMRNVDLLSTCVLKSSL